MDSDLEEYGNEGDDINVGTYNKSGYGSKPASQFSGGYGGMSGGPGMGYGAGPASYGGMSSGFGSMGTMGGMGAGGMGMGMAGAGGMGGMGMGNMRMAGAPGFGSGMMGMGMGLGMGGMNMGGMPQGDDAYQFDLNLDHIKAIEPPKSDPKNFKGKEKGGILRDPSKKKGKKEVKIGKTETIHYEKESSHYSSG